MNDVARLLAIMARLRDPERGCPWDVEQRFETIAPYTIEEAYEVDDAIRRGDLGALREELGDLLLQVVFHARMAEEGGAFAFGDVVETLCEKLVRRHPHVFGAARIPTAAAQTEAWEAQKTAERARVAAATGRAASALDGVARGLPALLRAQKLAWRAARAGLEPLDVREAGRRAQEALAAAVTPARGDGGDGPTTAPRARFGALLVAVADLAAAHDVDAEEALRDATACREAAWRERERKGRP